MRMRKKPNLDARMENCSDLLIASPEANRGIWSTLYPSFNEIRLEIGCGKGRFTADMAEKNPDVLFLAVEKVQKQDINITSNAEQSFCTSFSAAHDRHEQNHQHRIKCSV